MFEMTQSRNILNHGCHEKGETRTEWDFEFWCQLDGTFKSLLYHTQPDAVEMDETSTGDMRLRGSVWQRIWKFDLLLWLLCNGPGAGN